MTVKGKDGRTVTIPESLIGQLRFKQTDFKDKWDSVINSAKRNDVTGLTRGLRTFKNRDKEFEDTLKKEQIAESFKSAEMKIDKEKIHKILASLVNEITDKQKASMKKEQD